MAQSVVATHAPPAEAPPPAAAGHDTTPPVVAREKPASQAEHLPAESHALQRALVATPQHLEARQLLLRQSLAAEQDEPAAAPDEAEPPPMLMQMGEKRAKGWKRSCLPESNAGRMVMLPRKGLRKLR